MILKPFQRDPSEPYTVDAEIGAFFDDWMEFNREKVSGVKQNEQHRALGKANSVE